MCVLCIRYTQNMITSYYKTFIVNFVFIAMKSILSFIQFAYGLTVGQNETGISFNNRILSLLLSFRNVLYNILHSCT